MLFIKSHYEDPDALEEDVDVIKLICEAAKECGPEYDYGKIHERLSERT